MKPSGVVREQEFYGHAATVRARVELGEDEGNSTITRIVLSSLDQPLRPDHVEIEITGNWERGSMADAFAWLSRIMHGDLTASRLCPYDSDPGPEPPDETPA
jgi:hypothetical protein